MPSPLKLTATALGLCALLCVPRSATAQNHVINNGLQSWVDAAGHSRADMLILGDSLVAAEGWDQGFIKAASARWGLAGTGLIVDSSYGGYGDGYYIGTYQGYGWSHDVLRTPLAKLGYMWGQGPTTSNAMASSTGLEQGYFFNLNAGGPLDPQAGYDWHIWSAPGPGGGTLGAFRAGNDLGSPVQTVPGAFRPYRTADGLNHDVFSFDPLVGYDAMTTGGGVSDTTNQSIYYSRLLKAGSPHGVTVTSWGYGGRSVHDFAQDIYNQDGNELNHSTFSPQGRAAFLSALVSGAGASGKLQVVISEGFNDAAETDPSIHGITPGNSPAAFEDNLTTLISRMRDDWALAGMNPSDLSFTLLGMFEDGGGGAVLTRQYAQHLRNLALADPLISFIDLNDIAPTWAVANSLGYMGDNVHPTPLGAQVYASAMVGVMVPEPASLAVLALALPPLFSRRRRA